MFKIDNRNIEGGKNPVAKESIFRILCEWTNKNECSKINYQSKWFSYKIEKA